MRSGYFYMVKRFVYLGVPTHTLIPSPYLLLYPTSSASRVTRMLQVNRNKCDFTLPFVLILRKTTCLYLLDPTCLWRHAGTRLCAQQVAISPTKWSGICGIPLVNLRNLAVVRFPPIGATSAAVRPAPRSPA